MFAEYRNRISPRADQSVASLGITSGIPGEATLLLRQDVGAVENELASGAALAPR